MIWNYENHRIYSVDEKNELMAEASYVFKEDDEAIINHTYVNPSLRGQGIASDMMVVVVKYLTEKGLRVSATCSYAKKWLDNHKDLY